MFEVINLGTGIKVAVINQIKEYAEKKSYDKALELIRQQDLSQSFNSQFVRICGEVFLDTKNYKESRSTLIMAHRIAPEANRVIYDLIRLYVETGEQALVEQYYEQYLFNATEHDMEIPWLHYLVARGRRENAQKLYESLEVLHTQDRSDHVAYEFLRIFQLMGDEQQFDEEYTYIMEGFRDSEYKKKAQRLKETNSAETELYIYPDHSILEHDADVDVEESRLLEQDYYRMHPKEPEIVLMADDLDAQEDQTLAFKLWNRKRKEKAEQKAQAKAQKKATKKAKKQDLLTETATESYEKKPEVAAEAEPKEAVEAEPEEIIEAEPEEAAEAEPEEAAEAEPEEIIEAEPEEAAEAEPEEIIEAEPEEAAEAEPEEIIEAEPEEAAEAEPEEIIEAEPEEAAEAEPELSVSAEYTYQTKDKHQQIIDEYDELMRREEARLAEQFEREAKLLKEAESLLASVQSGVDDWNSQEVNQLFEAFDMDYKDAAQKAERESVDAVDLEERLSELHMASDVVTDDTEESESTQSVDRKTVEQETSFEDVFDNVGSQEDPNIKEQLNPKVNRTEKTDDQRDVQSQTVDDIEVSSEVRTQQHADLREHMKSMLTLDARKKDILQQLKDKR